MIWVFFRIMVILFQWNRFVFLIHMCLSFYVSCPRILASRVSSQSKRKHCFAKSTKLFFFSFGEVQTATRQFVGSNKKNGRCSHVMTPTIDLSEHLALVHWWMSHTIIQNICLFWRITWKGLWSSLESYIRRKALFKSFTIKNVSVYLK